MTQDAWRHHDPSAGRRCAGKLVSGRPVSELTSVREGGGEDDGEDVWTDNDAGIAGSGVDAGRCQLERRVSDLGWGWGLAFGARCGVSTTTSGSSTLSSGSAGSRRWATRRSFGRGVCIMAPFFPSRAASQVLFETACARTRTCARGRFVGDGMTTSMLALSLGDSVRVFLHSRRVRPLALEPATPLRLR